jgi:hypothetical protein
MAKPEPFFGDHDLIIKAGIRKHMAWEELNMDYTMRKCINLSMLLQLVAALFLYLGFITAYRYFPFNEGMAAGVILFLILAIIFWILTKAKMDTGLTYLPIVQAFDVGLIIGSYFTRFEVSFWPEALYVFAFSFGVITIVHLILKAISVRGEFIILCLIGLAAFFLIGLCFMGRSLLMRR